MDRDFYEPKVNEKCEGRSVFGACGGEGAEKDRASFRKYAGGEKRAHDREVTGLSRIADHAAAQEGVQADGMGTGDVHNARNGFFSLRSKEVGIWDVVGYCR